MKKEQNFIELPILRVEEYKSFVSESDALAVEEPLEIRLGFNENGKPVHKSISITMRTPGDDFDLTTGFLFTEGIIKSAAQINKIQHCGSLGKGGNLRNTVRVDLCSDTTIDLERLKRHFYTSSSCGVCGKTSIKALQTGVVQLKKNNNVLFLPEMIHRLPEALRAGQNVFDRTGGLHAAGLFDASGEMEILREDVGRHNAVDKLIGARFLSGNIPADDRLIMVSGRASFELVQKALMAGIPVLAAVGAPSSLAVELAQEYGMTLLGFVRNNRFNIYSGRQRIAGKHFSLEAEDKSESFDKTGPFIKATQ